MAILKCKSCGGNKMQDLGNGVFKCMYCGAMEKEEAPQAPEIPQPQQLVQPIYVIQQPAIQTPPEPEPEPEPEYGKMGFSDALRVCLIEKYACFSGRATRTEYWYYQLFFWLISTFLYILAFCSNSLTMLIIIGIILIVLLFPSWGVTVRRLHDAGRSGNWILLGLIPYVNFIGGIILLIFFCSASEPKSNQYGNYAIMN